MSTIDGGLNPATGAYKVVINQKEHAPPTDGAPSLPAIEVPIPHYRLGTPRFSTQGTAFLHSAVYSTSSAHEDSESAVSNGEAEKFFPLPPRVGGKSENASQQIAPVTALHMVQVNQNGAVKRLPIPTSTPIFHRSKEPITPTIYDAIAANPDNPAIVRYAIMSNREISAASPARIIAQITSKNFLDYELLSDFFLTVRAYLSTHDLLAYLLTRFEWAINRFDDDGRVIRVRAFAAIRHWVLNYFPYDFVVDRDLRVKFCERLNGLSHHVRKRSPQESSDLKLVMDLKKCWNGRCALYWDNPYAEMEGRLDIGISPGGIVGSRDSRLTHPSELWAKLAASSTHQLDQEKSVAALHNWVDSVIEAEVDGRSRAERQGSVSDPSVHAVSCAIPGKSLKGLGYSASRSAGAHPVSIPQIPASRKTGPSARLPLGTEKLSPRKAEHDRSGSFSDALRDKRTSLPMGTDSSKDQVIVNVPFSGSLVRGNVFPPGSPFIENITSPGSSTNAQKNIQYAMLDSNQLDSRPMSPGVRNLLTNLRRAWGGRQTPSAHPTNLLPGAAFAAEKNAALPMHIAFKIEGLGDQHHQLEALKKNSRIDLLCADVIAVFERIMAQAPGKKIRSDSIEYGADGGKAHLSPDPQEEAETPHRLSLARNPSAMTNGSRSIVIMDDTSSEPPVPHLPAKYSEPNPTDYSLTSAQVPFSIADLAQSPAASQQQQQGTQGSSSDYKSHKAEDETPQSGMLPDLTMPSIPTSPPQARDENKDKGLASANQKPRPSVGTSKSHRSNRSDSVSLRRYVSYQSGMRRSGMDNIMDSAITDSSPHSSLYQTNQGPGRMLRRRPGGDLRANETVHDLEPIPRPRSTGSITTYTESLHSSLRKFPEDAPLFKSPHAGHGFAEAKQPPPARPRSSRKNRRPSFEAAVAQFARIPDHEGGDLEATLAKLEGKFRKSPMGSSDGIPSPRVKATEASSPPKKSDKSENSKQQAQRRPDESENDMLTPPGTAKLLPSQPVPGMGGPEHSSAEHNTKSLYATSDDSYNPVPLLDRTVNKASLQRPQTESDQSQVSMPRPLFTANQVNHGFDEKGMPELRPDFERLSSVRRGRYRSSIPTVTTDSFLLDDDESLSGISSDLSDDDDEFGTNSVLDDAYGSASHYMSDRQIPPNAEYASGYLPSPPMTNENAAALQSEANRIQEERRPPTPEASPVSRLTESSKGRTPGEVDDSVLQPFANKVHQFPTRRHIPFVLAFDATVLAQQLTIIERDALNEINWQDLIDMRWNVESTTTLNWVEYLHFSDPSGIELVTARDNLVVRWAKSELVLTHNVEERALTMRKLIQIAQYARRIHNYATMFQLTAAMTSVDCSRLSRAWALVPEAERTALKDLEKLISPLRNFHNLRAEMDAENLEEGCIPVVGKSSCIVFTIHNGY